jgi:hypothetical protein
VSRLGSREKDKTASCHAPSVRRCWSAAEIANFFGENHSIFKLEWKSKQGAE